MLVRLKGLEPLRPKAEVFEASVSAIPTTSANLVPLEGFEPPHPKALRSKRSVSPVPPQGHLVCSVRVELTLRKEAGFKSAASSIPATSTRSLFSQR